MERWEIAEVRGAWKGDSDSVANTVRNAVVNGVRCGAGARGAQRGAKWGGTRARSPRGVHGASCADGTQGDAPRSAMETMAAIVPKVLETSVRVQAELAQQGIEGGRPRLSSGLGSALGARWILRPSNRSTTR